VQRTNCTRGRRGVDSGPPLEEREGWMEMELEAQPLALNSSLFIMWSSKSDVIRCYCQQMSVMRVRELASDQ
jgi:hypothetical protein